MNSMKDEYYELNA